MTRQTINHSLSLRKQELVPRLADRIQRRPHQHPSPFPLLQPRFSPHLPSQDILARAAAYELQDYGTPPQLSACVYRKPSLHLTVPTSSIKGTTEDRLQHADSQSAQHVFRHYSPHDPRLGRAWNAFSVHNQASPRGPCLSHHGQRLVQHLRPR